MIFYPQPMRDLRRRVQTVLGVLVAGLALAGSADAACLQDGADVLCSGEDSDGFDAGSEDALIVEVESGASVSNPAGDAIRVNEESTVNVRDDALVRSSAPGASAIRAGDGATITTDTNAAIESDGAAGVAIEVGSGGSSVQSQGAIRMSGDDITAISTGDNNGAIANLGTIELVGNNATAIAVGTNSGTAANLGTIQIVGDDAVGLQLGDSTSLGGSTDVITIEGDRAIGMDVGNDSFVQQFGRLLIDGEDGIGVRLEGSNDFENLPREIDGGEIGTIEVTGLNGVGVLMGANGGAGNTLENQGAIRGGSGTGAAVSTDTPGATGLNTIRNEVGGLLEAGGSGVAVRGGSGVDVLRNAGEITGDVLLEGNDDIYRLRGTGTVDGIVDGGAGSDLISLTGTTDGIFEGSTVVGFERLSLDGGAWALRGASAFGEGVTVTAQSDAILVLDQLSTLTADLTLEDEARVEARLDPDGPSGPLAVEGVVNVGSDVELTIVEVNPLDPGETFSLLTATGGIGSVPDPFNANLPADTAFLGFELVQSATEISLSVTRLRTYASLAETPNQTAVATNLDAISNADPTGEMGVLIDELNRLEVGDAALAYTSLQPEAYDAHTSTVISLSSAIIDEIASPRLRCGAAYSYQRYARAKLQPSPCGDREQTFWVDGVFLDSRRDPRGPQLSFQSRGGALLVGADLTVAGWLVSGFAGASYASIDTKGLGDGDVSSLEIGALAERRLGPVRVQTVALYGHGWHEQRREIQIAGAPPGPDALGRFESDRFFSRTEVGFPIALGGAVFEPLTQLEYSFVREDGFKESRAAGARLDVARRRAGQLRSMFGARLSYEGLQDYWLDKRLTWIDGTWRLDLEGRWLRVWNGEERAIQASFVESPGGVSGFRVQGKDIRQAALFGTHIQFQPLGTAVVIGVGYDFQFGDDTIAHRGTARFQLPF